MTKDAVHFSLAQRSALERPQRPHSYPVHWRRQPASQWRCRPITVAMAPAMGGGARRLFQFDDAPHDRCIRRAADARRAGQAGCDRRRRAQLHRSRTRRRLSGRARILPARPGAARRALQQGLRQVVPQSVGGATGRNDRRRSNTARRPSSSGRLRRRSSRRCARTRWRACSPTRSTAATRTSPAGVWSVFPARKRVHRRGHAKLASVHARAHHGPAGAGQGRRAEPWRSKKPMW